MMNLIVFESDIAFLLDVNMPFWFLITWFISNTIKFVMDNYGNIHKSIKKNKLPMKQEFISQMCKILD